MPMINIDGKDYDSEEMSKEELGQVQALQFIQNELVKIQMQGAVLQTAQNAYTRVLKSNLEKGEIGEEEATIDLPDDLTFD